MVTCRSTSPFAVQFNVASHFTVTSMLESKLHLQHSVTATSMWVPAMSQANCVLRSHHHELHVDLSKPTQHLIS